MDRRMTSALLGAWALLASVAPAVAGDGARHDAQVELGRRLFFDPAVSRGGTVSCSSCHDPDVGFSDPLARSRDEGADTPRHSQGLLDLADRTGAFHWDGEFATLRQLITARVGAPVVAATERSERLLARIRAVDETGDDVAVEALASELGRAVASTAPTPGGATFGGGYGAISPTPAPMPSRRRGPTVTGARRSVPDRLADGGYYDAGFRAAFGTDTIDHERVAVALEAYVLSLRSTESAFDRYLAGDDRALGPAATRGFELFAGKAGCTSCHAVPVPGKGRALSDGKLHNTGVAFQDVATDVRLVGPRSTGEVAPDTVAPDTVAPDIGPTDTGHSRISLRAADTAAFVTPGLRDVARTAPYMHDASLATLEDVVRYYDGGGTPNPHLDPAIRPLGLTDRDVADVVAFLEALSGGERPGLGELTSTRAPRLSVRVVDLEGKPLSGAGLVVRPIGDRLRGSDALPEPFEMTTSARGEATFPFPASTHVAIDLAGHELGQSRLLPDWTTSVVLIATPVDTVSVIVRTSGASLPSELLTTDASRGGAAVAFRRVRHLRGGRTLYAAPAADLVRFGSAIHASVNGGAGALGTFAFDPSGGASESIDAKSAKPDPEAVARLQGVVAQVVRSVAESDTAREALDAMAAATRVARPPRTQR